MTAIEICPGITVLERGWLSSNNILIAGHETALIDTGYVTHAAQTAQLVRALLNGRPLHRIVNTHLHSDHCGGNATLQREHQCEIWIPPGSWAAASQWDESALTYAATGQSCERFMPDYALRPGTPLELGGVCWQILAAPGHDPHSIILFEADSRTLISADALWESGFGVVFPELEGQDAFNEVESVLNLIERLRPLTIIPGHGPPFTDIEGALSRARERLKVFVASPSKHARHAAKVLLKFHMLDCRMETCERLLSWASKTQCVEVMHARYFSDRLLHSWVNELILELCRSGALRRVGDDITNA